MEMNREQMEDQPQFTTFSRKKQRSIVPGQIWMPLNAVENMRKKKSDECGGGSIPWNNAGEILT